MLYVGWPEADASWERRWKGSKGRKSDPGGGGGNGDEQPSNPRSRYAGRDGDSRHTWFGARSRRVGPNTKCPACLAFRASAGSTVTHKTRAYLGRQRNSSAFCWITCHTKHRPATSALSGPRLGNMQLENDSSRHKTPRCAALPIIFIHHFVSGFRPGGGERENGSKRLPALPSCPAVINSSQSPSGHAAGPGSWPLGFGRSPCKPST